MSYSAHWKNCWVHLMNYSVHSRNYLAYLMNYWVHLKRNCSPHWTMMTERILARNSRLHNLQLHCIQLSDMHKFDSGLYSNRCDSRRGEVQLEVTLYLRD